MSGEPSIYPIHQLYFECTGCKAQWMIRATPAIDRIEDLQAFLRDPNKTEPCPKSCGSKTRSVAFRLGPPTPGNKVDPFSIFKKEPNDG